MKVGNPFIIDNYPRIPAVTSNRTFGLSTQEVSGCYGRRMLTVMVDRFAARFPRAGRPLLWLRKHRKTRRTLIIAFFHLVGALTSIHAILNVRTAQGAIAWAV